MSEWIKCTERLPDIKIKADTPESEDVIIRFPGGGRAIGRLVNYPLMNEPLSWLGCVLGRWGEYAYWKLADVTEWMPIPE